MFWFLLVLPLTAHADLYRWIDPATGTVKLSSLPPADPGIEAEIVRFNAPATPKPATTPAQKPAAGTSVPELEARWHSLLTQLSGVSPQEFKQGSDGLRQQLEAFEALRVELDRLDPAGTARRKAETATMLERLKQAVAGTR
jgi:hypothetical protein